MFVLIGAGVLILVFIILYILDRFNVIRIFTRGRSGGIAGNTFQALQGFTEMNAQKAQEILKEEQEGKDKSQDKTGEKS
jgi:hypothetical protein